MSNLHTSTSVHQRSVGWAFADFSFVIELWNRLELCCWPRVAGLGKLAFPRGGSLSMKTSPRAPVPPPSALKTASRWNILFKNIPSWNIVWKNIGKNSPTLESPRGEYSWNKALQSADPHRNVPILNIFGNNTLSAPCIVAPPAAHTSLATAGPITNSSLADEYSLRFGRRLLQDKSQATVCIPVAFTSL